MSSPSPTVARRGASRCWTVVGPAGSATDLVVVGRDDELLGAVLAELRPALGLAVASLFDGATRLPDDLPLHDVRLRHGAILGIDRPLLHPCGAAPGALELRVVGGPDAGRTAVLGHGTHVLGRGPGSVVRLDDPDVSRRHAEVHVVSGTVAVGDLGSSNGSRLDDRDAGGAGRLPWPAGARLRLGATTLEVAGPGSAAAGAGTAGAGVAGRTVLAPSVRVSDVRPAVEVDFPPRPVPPPARRLAWVAVALPAVGGVGLALALRTPSFLFFALLSPLVAVASWWSDRRSGRRGHRRELADFEVRTAAAEAELSEAVRADVRASHRRLPDLAALASAARRRTSILWSRAPDDLDLLTVRVGTGQGATDVVRRTDDGGRTAVPAEDVPVAVDLRSGGLAVVGPRSPSLGVLRSVVGQLAALHPPNSVELVLVTAPERIADWRWARWLPHLRPEVVLVADKPGAANPCGETALRALLASVERRRAVPGAALTAQWSGPWTVVVADGSLPAAAAALLARATAGGVTVLTHGETLDRVPVPVAAALRVSGELGTRATLLGRSAARDVAALDQLPSDVAADLARDLAGLAPPPGRSTLPSDVRYLDVAGLELDLRDDDAVPVGWTRTRSSLEVALGLGSDGVERLDLCRQGPHALVAGTTGSGKSELLQTLIAGLALGHPPDRCSFLLVDYKGGAAFAEAAALPHTVGLLTDLDDATTARALRSLNAELARREGVLAAHSVPDIADLPADVPLARLVIVVDEFATLVEELPAFVPGLVGIAQRGRSLGIHLVLATQRPAGVVSADIRANCTLRICLRTTDEGESRDVLGGPEAAHLPLERPGRAYVRTGAGTARLLQVARVSQARPGDDDPPGVVPWSWPVAPLLPLATSSGTTDLATIVRDVGARARALSVPAPPRPWCPPLPTVLSVADAEALTGGAGRAPTELLLGVVDRPDRQEQHPLVLDLAEGGGWLAVGGPRSGRTTALRSVLHEAVTRQAPDRLHVHVVDLAGGGLAAAAARLPHVGTAVAGDALRTVRLVHRLAEEVARRRSTRAPGDPSILLLVDGAESLCSLLDEADPARGAGELHRLVRDGGAAGLTCVLSADRAVPGGRLAGVASRRLVLPLPDRADYAVAGITPAAVPATRPPGRCLLGEDSTECQLVLPPALDAGSGNLRAASAAGPAPLRIAELEPDPVVVGGPDAAAGTVLRVALGPGGDEGDPLCVDLLRTGGLLVIGPPGSGRSSTLHAIAVELDAAGVPVLRLGTPPRGTPTGASVADPADTVAVADWLAGRAGGSAVVCVDDLGPAGGAPALAALPRLGSGSGVALVAAASGTDLSSWFQGPVGALRRARTGVLLCPGPGDADLLGTRLPRTPVPTRPGSGWLVLGGVPDRVQVARRRMRAGTPQSSSSTDPISCVAYQASS